jgi:uncharacterized SAM-binding protein YcdF (DUF218 family)
MPSLQEWLKAVLLPPTSILLVSLIGLQLRGRWRVRIVGASIIVLTLLSVPLVPYGLAAVIATTRPYRPTPPIQEQAIVVLGGGVVTFAAEFDRPDVAIDTLQRVRLAAYLHRLTALPIAVTGYVPVRGSNRGLSDLMVDVLTREFNVSVSWRESRSRNTLENAAFTAEMLRPLGITRVVVVTDSFHMPRALWSFRRAGLEPTAAPIVLTRAPFELASLVPRVDGLVASYYLAYEIFGFAWYRAADLLGLISEPAHWSS